MSILRSLIILLLLGAASATLATRIRDDLQRPIEMPAIVASKAGTTDAARTIPEVPKYQRRSIAEYAAVFERPLFNTDRRPPSDLPTEVLAATSQALSATLQGIMFATSGSVALLTAVGETTPVNVAEGDEFLGWRLLEINPDNAVFSRDDETVTLELIYKVPPAPVKPKKKRR